MDREGNKLICDHCQFKNNKALYDGGAIYIDYGSQAKYKDSVFDNNSANNTGSAVYIISRASQLEETKVELVQNTYLHNTSPSGKQIVNADQSIVKITGKSPPKETLEGVLSR